MIHGNAFLLKCPKRTSEQKLSSLGFPLINTCNLEALMLHYRNALSYLTQISKKVKETLALKQERYIKIRVVHSNAACPLAM